MHFISASTSIKLARKTCLLRTNLDINDPQKNSVRIEKALPTIQFLLKHGAQPIIIGHRGRPKKPDPSLSVKPIIDILSEKVGEPLRWLENLRFDPREQKNDDGFARELASRADFYVNDDFATSHHSGALLVAITTVLPSYAGLLIEEELRQLSRVRDRADKPLVVIIGGIKIEDKLGVINYLKTKVDYFLLGSAYGALRETLPKDATILIPKDGKGAGEDRLDIGPETTKEYSEIIARAKTIIWSGPLGNIENPAYADGSETIARAIAASGAFSVVGGGDTLEFLTDRGLITKFSFVSTGGGAMLEFLAGEKLPALEALDKCPLV